MKTFANFFLEALKGQAAGVVDQTTSRTRASAVSTIRRSHQARRARGSRGRPSSSLVAACGGAGQAPAREGGGGGGCRLRCREPATVESTCDEGAAVLCWRPHMYPVQLIGPRVIFQGPFAACVVL